MPFLSALSLPFSNILLYSKFTIVTSSIYFLLSIIVNHS